MRKAQSKQYHRECNRRSQGTYDIFITELFNTTWYISFETQGDTILRYNYVLSSHTSD